MSKKIEVVEEKKNSLGRHIRTIGRKCKGIVTEAAEFDWENMPCREQLRVLLGGGGAK